VARLVGVQLAENVHVAARDYFINPDTLLRQKAGRVLVLVGTGQINRAVSGVHVPAEDDRAPLGAQPLGVVQEGGLVGHLEGNAAVIARAIGEVRADQHEVAVVGDDCAPFLVVLRDAQPDLHVARRDLAVERHAAVALLDRRPRPKAVVAVRVAQRLVNLVGLRFGLLQAEHVRLNGVNPRQQSLAVRGTNPVHVPRIQSEHKPSLAQRWARRPTAR